MSINIDRFQYMRLLIEAVNYDVPMGIDEGQFDMTPTKGLQQ